MRHRLALFALAALLTIAPALADTVLRRGNSAEPATLDPQGFVSFPESRILLDLDEGLTADGPGGAIIPGAAERWTVSDDGLVWTFTLRPNLTWSNGDPLTTEDFVYSLRRLVAPATAAHIAFLVETIVGAEDIIAGRQPDLTRLGAVAETPLQLRITLTIPNPSFPAILANLAPSHRGSVEAFGNAAFRPGNMVSNGAYRLIEWTPQSRIVLARNPRYWNADHVSIDRVEFYPIENQDEEMKRYRAGDLDLTDSVPHGQLALVRQTMAAEYHVSPLLAVTYLGFNLTRPPFKDALALRQALTLAVDRTILTEKVVEGGVVPAYSWIPPSIDGYQAAVLSWRDKTQAERNDMARAAYRAAGYGPDHPLHVKLLYNTSENNRRLMLAVSGMWRQVLGVETELENQEFKTFLDTRQLKQATETFRGAFVSFYADPLPMLETLMPSSPYNDEGWRNEDYAALFRQAMALPDRAARLKRFGAAEAMVLDELPILPLYFNATEHLISPRVTGWQPSPRDSFRSQDLAIR